MDAGGDLFIADSGLRKVDEVPPYDGAQTTVGAGVTDPAGVAVYAQPPTFTADTPPATATVGTPYDYDFVASDPSATFALASGSLPPGLNLELATGSLTGTPTTAGTYHFVVETENAANGTLGPPITIIVSSGSSHPPQTLGGETAKPPITNRSKELLT